MATMARSIGLALVVAVSALAFAGVASPATPKKADKHDRMLIKKLLTAAQVGGAVGDTDEDLLAIAQACPAGQSVDPALLLKHMEGPAAMRAVDRSEPELLSWQRLYLSIRPHAAVFKQWIARQRTDMAIFVKFAQGLDSSRLDICAYLESIIPAAADDEAAQTAALVRLFANPEDIAALIAFAGTYGGGEASRKAVNARFAAFLRASRYTKAQIALLTG